LTEQIPIGKIKPSPYQPRLTFDLEDIRGSVMKDGILVGLTVREKDGYYELIDGERRLRLAKDLGYETVKCDVIDVTDDVARRMVWKVNTLRKDYTPKEKAYHFKKLQKMGMSVRAIALDCDERWNTVQACLNLLKLSKLTKNKKYENLVFGTDKLSLGHIEELGDLFNSSTNVERITEWLDRIMEQKLTVPEMRKARKPELEEIERKRVESAKKAVGKITTEVKDPDSPEELDKAAQALKREAKKKRESQLSEKEKEKQKAEKQRKKEEQQRKREEKKRKEEEKRKKREEQIRKQAEEEAKQKLMQDKDFLQAAAKVASKSTETEVSNELDEVGIPSVPEQIDKFYSNIAKKVKGWQDEKPSLKELTNFVLGFVERQSLSCPVCGEKKIVWKCGHEFK